MTISGLFGSALLGIQRGMNGLNRDAAQLASAKAMNGQGPTVEPLVDSKVNRLQLEASAKAAQTIDQAIGSLFNDKA